MCTYERAPRTLTHTNTQTHARKMFDQPEELAASLAKVQQVQQQQPPPPRAEALPQPSRPQQQLSPAEAPLQGTAEGIGTGDDQGQEGSRGGGEGHVGADARKADLPAREGQVNSPAIHAGGNGKGKEKAAEGDVMVEEEEVADLERRSSSQQRVRDGGGGGGHLRASADGQGKFPAPIHEEEKAEGDVEEEEEEVADSEDEGVQKSRSMRKQVAGPCPPCAEQNNSIAVCFAQGHLYLTPEGEVPSSCKDTQAPGFGGGNDARKGKGSVVSPRTGSGKGRGAAAGSAAATLGDKDVEKIKKRLMKRVSDNGLKCHIPGCNEDFSSYPNQRRNAAMIRHMKYHHPDELKPKGGMCVCVYVYTYVYIHTYIHTCMHAYIHTYVCIYIHMYVHTYYICIYVHTYIHTYEANTATRT